MARKMVRSLSGLLLNMGNCELEQTNFPEKLVSVEETGCVLAEIEAHICVKARMLSILTNSHIISMECFSSYFRCVQHRQLSPS